MKLLVVSDAHISEKVQDKSFWCRTAVHGYNFWERYLEVFDEVNVIARVYETSNLDESTHIRADGPKISIVKLPFARGIRGYFRYGLRLMNSIRKSINDEECAIFRLPSMLTFIALKFYKLTDRPYAIEVVVDPEHAYKYNFFACKLLTHLLKKECRNANGVSYVTQFHLQQKYPSHSILSGESERYFSAYYSSINLESSFYYKRMSYKGSNLKSRLRIIHVTSLIVNDDKGHSTLLKIIKKLHEMGINAELTCVGGGDKIQYYEEMSKQLGISDYVEFVGQFSDKTKIREYLIDSDMMIFPSKAEGLPRVIIEAMAVGLPCLASNVDGIPELIDSKNLFASDDVNSFVTRVNELIINLEELDEMSKANYKKAKEYDNTVLTVRRNSFYSKLRKLAEAK